MRTRLKMKLCLLPAAAVFLILTFARVADAATSTPFRGTLQGQETDVLQGSPPSQILIDGGVSGVATPLGQFTLAYKGTVSLPIGSSTGSAQLTAANGDKLFTMFVGLGTAIPNMPGLNTITEIDTITGGTGRFAAATGSFTVERLVNLTDLTEVPTFGTFTGNIVLAVPTD